MLCVIIADKMAMNHMIIRTYSELIKLPTFEERYEYLKLDGKVGEETFGFDRYINQEFYRSNEWLKVRDFVIVRDGGCDLAIEDREIFGKILVHHMNPITIDDILNRSEFTICEYVGQTITRDTDLRFSAKDEIINLNYIANRCIYNDELEVYSKGSLGVGYLKYSGAVIRQFSSDGTDIPVYPKLKVPYTIKYGYIRYYNKLKIFS